MANNIQVTQGAGTVIKTTDTAGVHTPHHNVDNLSVVVDALKGITKTQAPAAQSDGQAQNPLLTAYGAQVVIVGSIPELSWRYAAASGGIVNTSDVAIQAAHASLRHYVRSIQIKNSHASVATEVVIKDGSTIIWRGHYKAAMDKSDVIVFDPPLRGTAATAINVACITTGAAVYVNAQGYTGV